VTALRIREVFKRLLKDAARAGIGWNPHETPYEYAERFAQSLPDAGPQMAELTHLYVNVRYSASDAADAQVSLANGLWRHIRELLRNSAAGGT
jgi:hypothetical protein